MAAPKFAPVSPTDTPRSYASPDHVPDRWMPDRPGDLRGGQPAGTRLGAQGPDQGYALKLAERLRSEVKVQPGESVEDALRGATLIGLRRASLFGRAPVIHDLRLGLMIWGFLDPDPPADVVAARKSRFEGVANVAHHYAEGRAIADMVPEATLRMSLDQVAAEPPGRWRALTGLG